MTFKSLLLPTLLLLCLSCARDPESYRPGKAGDQWTYQDSSFTNGNSMVRERIERLGKDAQLTTADGRTIRCRTVDILSNGEPLSRLWVEDTGDELRIHRLDHLSADEVIRYDPYYPMLADTRADSSSFICLVLLAHGADAEPYHRIEVGLDVFNRKDTLEINGAPRDVLVQTLREQGTAGMTYRNTWLKGFGLLDQEIEGSSAQYSSRSHIRLISPMPR